MKYLIIIFSLVIFGCNGEIEDGKKSEPIKPKIEILNVFPEINKIEAVGKKMLKAPIDKPVKVVPVEKACPKPVVEKKTIAKKKYLIFNEAERIKSGYKYAYDYKSGDCRGRVFQKSVKYYYYNLFVDCRNNYVFQRVRK